MSNELKRGQKLEAQRYKEGRISLKTLGSNCFYIVKYAFGVAPRYYMFYMMASSILQSLQSIITVLIYKLVLDLVKTGQSVNAVLQLMTVLTSITVLAYICHKTLLRYHEVKSTEISGKIQRKIIEKASGMDILCYDKTEFYDDFIRAAERGETQITACVTILVDMLASMTSILSVIVIIMTIDPVVAFFPFTACVINFLTLFWMNRVKYQMLLELDPVNRKKFYSRRVFYQPEYAKEMRLSNIREPLMKQFEDSIVEEREIVKRYGRKLTIASLANYMIGWTVCVYYLPPLYMIYQTMVPKSMKIGDLAAMHNANTEVFYTLNDMSSKVLELQKLGQYGENFRHFMDYEITIENQEGDPVSSSEPQTIELHNVSFGYEEEKPVLKNISMTIHPGEKIAIVGHNGAGKTTFTKLLLHLYNPTEGTILYGGKDILNYATKEYRKVFGVVLQDFQVFAGTVEENVTMESEKSVEEDSIDKALELSGMKNKVVSFPKGIHTQLTREFSEEGTLLSGGESQRIAISRIFVRNCRVAILDEPSSALDPMAEYQLNKNMLEATKDATVIFISHRLSTTRMADKIYMFEHGEIIEEGTHEELMQLQGKYANMFEKQARYYQ